MHLRCLTCATAVGAGSVAADVLPWSAWTAGLITSRTGFG